MSASCREILERLGPYAAEELPASERRVVRDHLAACGDCRREALEADPTLLFAGPVPIEDVSAADAARILEGVKAAVSVRQAERRLGSGEANARKVGRRRATTAAAPGGATVYEITPGRGPNEPRVVWIVDGSLDI